MTMQRLSGGLLLRFLLRGALTACRQTAPDLHFDDEALVVVRSDLVDYPVLRQLQTAALSQLLQGRLVIVKEQIVDIDRIEIALKCALHDSANGLHSAIEIDAGEHGLEEVGQQRILLPAA